MNSQCLKIRANAKLNLALDVLNKREDGYHNMNMVMQSVELHDFVLLERAGHGIMLECDGLVPGHLEQNTAYRSAKLYFDTFRVDSGIKIRMSKRIPFEAGLAGGSADAAAVFAGMNKLFGTGLSVKELCALGAKIGADVPFCIVGGTARVTGIGETVEPIRSLPDCAIVIAKPERGISTKEAFAAIDSLHEIRHPDFEEILDCMKSGDLVRIGAAMENVFEQVTVLPEVFRLKETMRNNGAIGSVMSGSGSAVFGLFADEKAAKLCVSQLRDQVPFAMVTKPVSEGVTIE